MNKFFASFLHDKSAGETLALDVTSNEKWGPHGEELAQLASMTLASSECWLDDIWPALRMRLTTTPPERWRQMYKALTTLEYLVARGCERVARDCRANANAFERLMKFEYVDDRGKDEGINVREKAKKVLALVSDENAVSEARAIAARNRGKYSGMSSEQARERGGTSTSVTNDERARERGRVDDESRVKEGISRSASGGASASADGDAEARARDRTRAAANGASAAATKPRTIDPAPARGRKNDANDSSEDEGANAGSNAAPKIIFRDVPAPRPTDSSFAAVSSFAPPPRAKLASTAAVNYSMGAHQASSFHAAPSTSSASIDDLLGGLSAPAPAAGVRAPPASTASPWAGLDVFATVTPVAPPLANESRAHANADPFASLMTSSAPPSRRQPNAFADGFGFDPPPSASRVASQTHSSSSNASANDPFGLSSLSKPSLAPAPPLRATTSPKKPSESIDSLAELTADLGMKMRPTHASRAPMNSANSLI